MSAPRKQGIPDSTIEDRPLGKQLANGRDTFGWRVIEHFENVGHLLLAEHDRPLIGLPFGRHLVGVLQHKIADRVTVLFGGAGDHRLPRRIDADA